MGILQTSPTLCGSGQISYHVLKAPHVPLLELNVQYIIISSLTVKKHMKIKKWQVHLAPGNTRTININTLNIVISFPGPTVLFFYVKHGQIMDLLKLMHKFINYFFFVKRGQQWLNS